MCFSVHKDILRLIREEAGVIREGKGLEPCVWGRVDDADASLFAPFSRDLKGIFHTLWLGSYEYFLLAASVLVGEMRHAFCVINHPYFRALHVCAF
jgi:hypothetical protein